MNNYFFYIDKNKKINSLRENDWDKDDTFIIYYALNYEKDENFFEDLESICEEKGFKEFISHFDINKKYYQHNIEKNKNIVGNFINIRINNEDIKKMNIINEANNDSNSIQDSSKISQKDNRNLILELQNKIEK